LRKKYELIRESLPRPVIDRMEGAKIGIMYFGSTEAAIEEARHRLAESGIQTDALRLRALPFSQAVGEFIRGHEHVYVVELNRDGQLQQLLKMEYALDCVNLISLAHLDGLPLTARWVEEAIKAKEAN
jgi:2-oxoglutarate ferredoxin oxidoreductase subunit alpha